MIVASPLYRPNPERCVYIDGKITDELVSKITPSILKHQRKSRAPITVYILNSPGGLVSSMESILKLLAAPSPDFEGPCRVLTVVTSRAASAAADLLCSGDYSIAYPNSTLLYHGIRTYDDRPLTTERTSLLANWLRISSDVYAWKLARKIENRFMFLYFILRNKFNDVRAKRPKETLSDFECFLALLMEKLSDHGKEVWKKAHERYGRYETLLSQITPTRKTGKRTAENEARQIKKIIEFEVAANKNDKNWSFRFGGLGRLSEDFYLLTECIEGREDERLREWCRHFEKIGLVALPQAEQDQLSSISDEATRTEKLIDLVRPHVLPVWSFFIALCHALQDGENLLAATDAYWLGLVDEVFGDPETAGQRLIGEYRPDPPAPAKESNEKETTKETGGAVNSNSSAEARPQA